VAHPIQLGSEDINNLQKQLDDPSSHLGPASAAVAALIVAGKKVLGIQ
jgi:hypothetical protein